MCRIVGAHMAHERIGDRNVLFFMKINIDDNFRIAKTHYHLRQRRCD